MRATAATVGGFPLLAVFVYVADENPAVYAGMGAQALAGEDKQSGDRRMPTRILL
jgi:hypothetical protein